jgi:HK97 family phage prohead protease
VQLESGGDGRTVTGRVVPYGETIDFTEDGGGRERFLPGSLDKMARAWHRVGLFFTHADTFHNALGYGSRLEERADGAWGTFRLYAATADKAREVLLSSHRGLSLGYYALTSQTAADGVIERVKVAVEHVAAVMDPAYRGALVESVRADGERPVTPKPEDAGVAALRAAQGAARPNLDEALALIAELEQSPEHAAQVAYLRGRPS